MCALIMMNDDTSSGIANVQIVVISGRGIFTVFLLYLRPEVVSKIFGPFRARLFKTNDVAS